MMQASLCHQLFESDNHDGQWLSFPRTDKNGETDYRLPETVVAKAGFKVIE
jgi:hypothetical protein